MRPTFVPTDPESREQLRLEHAALQLARQGRKDSAREALGSACQVCKLVPRSCICAVLRPLPSIHAVTVLLHPAELGRASSTHAILSRGLKNSDVAVWGSSATPDMRSVLCSVARACDVSGRTPVFLFPAPQALSVRGLHAALPPERRRSGLHVIVLDGTWANVRPLVRDMPPGAACVVVRPGTPHALFGPLRTQPNPGRVSTAEAVACLFDEWRGAAAAAAGAEEAGASHSVGTPKETIDPDWLQRYVAAGTVAQEAASAGPAQPEHDPSASDVGDDDDDDSVVRGGGDGDVTSLGDGLGHVYLDEGGVAGAAVHKPVASAAFLPPPEYLAPSSPLHLRPLLRPPPRSGSDNTAAAADEERAGQRAVPALPADMYLDLTATRLRGYLMALVDAMILQRGQMTGPRMSVAPSAASARVVAESRGAGYGTWTMGVAPQPRRLARFARAAATLSAGDACSSPEAPAVEVPAGADAPGAGGRGGSGTIGPFNRLPAFLVRHILSFIPTSPSAAAEGRVAWPQGYYPRHAGGSSDWTRSALSVAVSAAADATIGRAVVAGVSGAREGAFEAAGSPRHAQAASPSSIRSSPGHEDGSRAEGGGHPQRRRREPNLPHLPAGCCGGPMAATCTDFWHLACGRASPSSRFVAW